MNVEKQAVKRMLSVVPTMIVESQKTGEVTQQILALKIYELEMFLKHVLTIIEQEEKEPHLYINEVGKA
jgi:hypothetical protein